MHLWSGLGCINLWSVERLLYHLSDPTGMRYRHLAEPDNYLQTETTVQRRRHSKSKKKNAKKYGTMKSSPLGWPFSRLLRGCGNFMDVAKDFWSLLLSKTLFVRLQSRSKACKIRIPEGSEFRKYLKRPERVRDQNVAGGGNKNSPIMKKRLLLPPSQLRFNKAIARFEYKILEFGQYISARSYSRTAGIKAFSW